MTAEQFRKVALGLADTNEASHVGHPDFRVHGRIFATLGYPDERFGMVKLSSEQQRETITRHPQVFTPAAGAWGRAGSTLVLLEVATVNMMPPLLEQACKNIVAKQGRSRRLTV